jgi:hypothetical protein
MECCFVEGELIRLDGGKTGLTLRCRSGLLWLTKGDGQDYLIADGNGFALGRGETALVEALKSSELSLGEPASVAAKTVMGLAAC